MNASPLTYLGIVAYPSDITSEEEGGEETAGLVLDGGWYRPLPRSGIFRSRRPDPLGRRGGGGGEEEGEERRRGRRGGGGGEEEGRRGGGGGEEEGEQGGWGVGEEGRNWRGGKWGR